MCRRAQVVDLFPALASLSPLTVATSRNTCWSPCSPANSLMLVKAIACHQTFAYPESREARQQAFGPMVANQVVERSIWAST
jgi:hypothetical protein